MLKALTQEFRADLGGRIGKEYDRLQIDRDELHLSIKSIFDTLNVKHGLLDRSIDHSFYNVSQTPALQLSALLENRNLSLAAIATEHRAVFKYNKLFRSPLLLILAKHTDKDWAKKDICDLDEKDFRHMREDTQKTAAAENADRHNYSGRIGPELLAHIVTLKVIFIKIRKDRSVLKPASTGQDEFVLPDGAADVIAAMTTSAKICARLKSLLTRPEFKAKVVKLLVEECARK